MRHRDFALPALALLVACSSTAPQGDAFPPSRATPADALCTVPQGTVVTLATGVSPEFFAATDRHVYWTELDANDAASTLFRVDATQAAPVETVGAIDQASFAIAGSVVLSAKGDTPTLAELGVDAETGSDVSNGAELGPFGGASFDGTTLFASFHTSTRLAQLPLSGGPTVTTSLDPTQITGIAAVDGVAFVATSSPSGSDVTTYAGGSATPTTILTSLGSVTQIVADSSYVYFTAIAGDSHAAIYSARHDGSGKSVVVDGVGGPFAIDGANVYFAKSGALSRFDQRTGKTMVLGSVDPQLSPAVLVQGANVFWAYAPYGALSAPLRPGAILTTCK